MLENKSDLTQMTNISDCKVDISSNTIFSDEENAQEVQQNFPKIHHNSDV